MNKLIKIVFPLRRKNIWFVFFLGKELKIVFSLNSDEKIYKFFNWETFETFNDDTVFYYSKNKFKKCK